jgi:hypothetical protein
MIDIFSIILSVVKKVEATMEAGLARSVSLRQSVLRSAFESKLH